MSDSFVYIISKFENDQLVGPVKVGMSNEPWKRVATIQTACPFKVELAWIFEVPNKEIARALERSFHETQVDASLHGEWFDFSPVEAIHLLCIAYRAMLHVTSDLDGDETEALLTKAGVITAEQRWGLAVPGSAN